MKATADGPTLAAVLRRLAALGVLGVGLILPAQANAAPPQCGGPFAFELPAGETVKLPAALCSGADTIKITKPPEFGTLDPPDTIPGDAQLSYTANAGAAGMTDVVRFRAMAGQDLSDEVSIEYAIGPVNRAPVCDDVAVSMTAGTSVRVPFARCVDPDGHAFEVIIEGGPARGTFNYGAQSYTPVAGFSGEDLMTFRAADSWLARSALRSIRITVTPAPQPSTKPGPSLQPPPDVTAPTLELRAPSARTLRRALARGLRIKAKTNEAGTITARALITRSTARRLGFAKNPSRAVALARLKRQVAAGKTVLTFRLTRKARARLARASRAELRIVATISDSAGNARTRTLKLKLS